MLLPQGDLSISCFLASSYAVSQLSWPACPLRFGHQIVHGDSQLFERRFGRPVVNFHLSALPLRLLVLVLLLLPRRGVSGC